jgi:hypothetical protein
MTPFSLFLQREGAEDVLDFWLDVQQHENLCRAYFKDVRKSGRTIREDWPQYWEYARRRGSIYGTIVAAPTSSSPSDKRNTVSTEGVLDTEKEKMGGYSRSPTPGTPMFDGKVSSEMPRPTTPSNRRQSAKRASRAPTVIPRDAAITRTDLIASAERIFDRYLVAASDKEIYLPPSLRIHSFPLSSNQLPSSTSPAYEIEANALAQVPDMFHAQKEYVFRAMEQDAFPRFLRAKAFGNLTPVSALVRLCVGLLVLWAGLATAFALVFLDVTPKSKRFFVSLFTPLSIGCDSSVLFKQLFIPFTLAFLFLISHQYELDPILVFLGQSETTPFRTLRIREPYVRKLLLGRATWVATLIAICVVALTMIFWAVPGHRL